MISKQARAIFLEAVEIDSAQERVAFLERACGDDSELRRKVDRLVHAHEQDDSLFDQTAAMPPRPTAQPGQMIGPYKLLQEIGEGGMGVVFMAEQREPVNVKVALKSD